MKKIKIWQRITDTSLKFGFQSHETILKSKGTKKCMTQLLSFNIKIIKTSVFRKLHRKVKIKGKRETWRSFRKGRHALRFRKVQRTSEEEKRHNPFAVASNVKARGRETAGKIQNRPASLQRYQKRRYDKFTSYDFCEIFKEHLFYIISANGCFFCADWKHFWFPQKFLTFLFFTKVETWLFWIILRWM